MVQITKYVYIWEFLLHSFKVFQPQFGHLVWNVILGAIFVTWPHKRDLLTATSCFHIDNKTCQGFMNRNKRKLIKKKKKTFLASFVAK